MRRPQVFLVGILVPTFAAGLVGACGGEAKVVYDSGIEIVVRTASLGYPQDYDSIGLEVQQEASPGVWRAPILDGAWPVVVDGALVTPDAGAVSLPATFAVIAGQSGDQKARIVATALRGGVPIVLREVVLELPTDRVAELDLLLDSDCRGYVTVNSSGDAVSLCPADESCQPTTGQCGPDTVDDTTLPTYDGGIPPEDASGEDAARPLDAAPPLDAAGPFDAAPPLDAARPFDAAPPPLPTLALTLVQSSASVISVAIGSGSPGAVNGPVFLSGPNGTIYAAAAGPEVAVSEGPASNANYLAIGPGANGHPWVVDFSGNVFELQGTSWTAHAMSTLGSGVSARLQDAIDDAGVYTFQSTLSVDAQNHAYVVTNVADTQGAGTFRVAEFANGQWGWTGIYATQVSVAPDTGGIWTITGANVEYRPLATAAAPLYTLPGLFDFLAAGPNEAIWLTDPVTYGSAIDDAGFGNGGFAVAFSIGGSAPQVLGGQFFRTLAVSPDGTEAVFGDWNANVWTGTITPAP